MIFSRRSFIKSSAGLSALTLTSSLYGETKVTQAAREQLSDYADVAEAPYLQPAIQVDEWRDEPVRHRFVQGGFEDTDLLFSLYFPPEDRYEGRFFQPLAAVSGAYNMAPMALFSASGLGFALASGGYLVESNQGSRHMFGGSSKANAAVARFARSLAADMYGPHRPFGYVYGGSGGAFKTKSCVENYPGCGTAVFRLYTARRWLFLTRLLSRRTPCAFSNPGFRRSLTPSSRVAAAICTPTSTTRSAPLCVR